MHVPDQHRPSPANSYRNTSGARVKTLLEEGSLALSVTLPDLRPDMLCIYGTGLHWSRPGGAFGIWISPRGALVLRHRTPGEAVVGEGPAEFCGSRDRIRISYQVWCPLGYAVLRAENGTTGATLETRISPPQALPLSEGWTDLPPHMAPTIEIAAQPIAPRGLNGFAFGTIFPTPHGPFAVEELLPGDVIQTPTGPVMLRDMWIEPMTDVQRQEAITLRAPYFGLTHSLTVLPDQRFLLGSVEVQSMTGLPEVLVAAQDLVIGRAAHLDWTGVGPMVHLSFEKTLVLPIGKLSLVCPGTAVPDGEGAVMPSPGDTPWATVQEAQAVVEALARRKGIIADASWVQRTGI